MNIRAAIAMLLLPLSAWFLVKTWTITAERETAQFSGSQPPAVLIFARSDLTNKIVQARIRADQSAVSQKFGRAEAFIGGLDSLFHFQVGSLVQQMLRYNQTGVQTKLVQSNFEAEVQQFVRQYQETTKNHLPPRPKYRR